MTDAGATKGSNEAKAYVASPLVGDGEGLRKVRHPQGVALQDFPRVLIIQTFYPEFLKDLYTREPELKELDFDAHCARLLGSAFGTGDAYSHGLRVLGCEALEVVCNADPAQARWAQQHGLTLHGNIHDQRRQIVAAQIERFDPDVVYVFEWCPLGDNLLASMRKAGRLVVGEIASPLPPDRTFRGYDLMISSWPPIVEHFRGEGIPAEFLRLGFDGRILDRLSPCEPRHDVSFVGGFAPSHPDRIAWLEEMLRAVDIDVFCYGLERTGPDSPIRRHYRGQAWGWDMYRTLQQSRITLNRHARLEVRGSVNTEWVNNMRMYEATGVGACLMTEHRPYLDRFFEPDREVVTYRDTAECVEKIRYYLDHEKERAAVARAGQARTLGEHLYTDRMGELLDILKVRSSKFKVRRKATKPLIRAATVRERVPATKGRRGPEGRLRIGIVPAFKRHDGGVYQYTVTFLNAMYEISTSPDSPWEHEFVVFTHQTDDPALRRITEPRWSIKPFRPPWAPNSVVDLTETLPLDSPGEQLDMRSWFLECGIDLMIYPSPHRLSFESGIPFVMAIHDLQHLLQPEFPEVSADGEWRRREYVLRNAARSATLLIAESKTGREDILNAYGPLGVDPDRIRVLPYLPSTTIDATTARGRVATVRGRYDLPERYFFYPAQFWPHKNHLRLIEALGLLRKQDELEITLVLTGSGNGAIRQQVVEEIQARCAALGVQGQVRRLGYVPDEDVAVLYAGAVALVMPTFFGPTNIPFLEAWALECPVMTSRIRGIVEQVGDAAVLIDPKNIAEIADGMYRLWTNEPLRRTLIANGRDRLGSLSPQEFRRRLTMIVDDAAARIARIARIGPQELVGAFEETSE